MYRVNGIADVGDDKASPGSRLIQKALIKDDPRPLNVVVNAGSNTLAQALYDCRAIYKPSELNQLVGKLCVFENGAQDNAGAWICHEFPSIHWIRSNHQTYGYMGQGNGFLEGGGTIPWMGLVNKGLYDPEQPSWGGWSGRFTAAKQKNVWSRHKAIKADEAKSADFYTYTETTDTWIDPDSDKLKFLWYPYPEAGTCDGTITIENNTQSTTEFVVPKNASGKQIHLILQVHDTNPIVSFYDYRRIVIDIEP